MLVAGCRPRGVLAGLLLELRLTNRRSSNVISTIITIPPRYSASVNCQPISTHSTRPSSHTRFVEANWNASAEAALAPFWNRDFAIAIAA